MNKRAREEEGAEGVRERADSFNMESRHIPSQGQKTSDHAVLLIRNRSIAEVAVDFLFMPCVRRILLATIGFAPHSSELACVPGNAPRMASFGLRLTDGHRN